ncbi:MAG: ion channel [Actinomycetes bacterium]
MDQVVEPNPRRLAALRRKPVIFDDQGSRYLDRFGLLLVLVVLTVVILSLVDINEADMQLKARIGSVAASSLVAVTLLLAFRASGLARRWQRIADVIVAIGIAALVVMTAASAIIDTAYKPAPAPLLIVFFAAVAPIVIVRRLIEHRVVTRATLLGAVSAYLLIGVTYFFLFLASGQYEGVQFFGTLQPTTSFMYFSLTTVTTTGYGDLTAATNVGRLLATSEMVIGQVYLVTFVAMIVGLYASGRNKTILGD